MTSTVSTRSPKLAAVAAMAIGALIGVSAVSVWVVQSSKATLSDTTGNTSNVWAVGTLDLTDNDSGTAMFNATNLSPSDVVTKCIQVTYTSTVTPAAVKIYGTASGGLATYLDTTVEEGTGGGAFSSCAGFTSTSTIYTGTLANFATTHNSFGTGSGVWAPSSSPATITYRISTTVQNTQAVQGLTADASFTWEARA